MRKTAMVTGVTGQTGSYLAEYLLEKEYEVVGLMRRSSTNTQERIKNIRNHENFKLEECDITDFGSLYKLFDCYEPDLCFNMAAQSHVHTSFHQPAYTFDVTAKGVIHLLDSIRLCGLDTKFIQASTSEMYGNNCNVNGFRDENTPFAPVSPYACAKLAAHHLVHTYKKAYKLNAGCAIIFNMESPRRGEEFVTRKITKWIGKFYNKYLLFYDNAIKIQDMIFRDNRDFDILDNEKLRLGNLDAQRDWQDVEDVVEGLYLMSQEQVLDDYVFASGENHSVRDFLDLSFKIVGISDWSKYVEIDIDLKRPAEVHVLLGDPTKAKIKLGWNPKHSFYDLVNKMVLNDINEQKFTKKTFSHKTCV